MHIQIANYISSMKGITLKDLTGFKRSALSVTLEGNALHRSIKLNGKELNIEKYKRRDKVPTDSPTWQWGCGFYTGQLLLAYAILSELTNDDKIAERYTNVVDATLLRNLPDNFKTTFNMKKLIVTAVNQPKITGEALATVLSAVADTEEVEDPNAPVMDFDEVRTSVLGASINRI